MSREIAFGQQRILPGKIVCVGCNYVEHIRELNNEVPQDMVFFCKPSSSVASTPCAVHGGAEIHYEGEICFLVQDRKLAAVGFGLDLTKRELQQTVLTKNGLPWERCKAWPGAAVFSPFTAIQSLSPRLRLELIRNDALVQQGGCEQMIYKPDQILAEAISALGLEENDVIMTGTPKGVGPLQKGDTLTGRILDGDRELVSASWTVD